jgi:predicted nucleic acid-binding protein
MERYILDTSFLQALLNSEDVHSTEALEIIADLPEEAQIAIPYIVVAELLIGKESEGVIDSCKEISKRFVRNRSEDLDYISTMKYSIRKKLKANDCLILSVSKRLSAKLLTFDKLLNQYHSNQ